KHARFALHQFFQLVDEARNRSVEAECRPRRELNLAGIAACALEHINSAELIEITARECTEAVLQLPRREIQILRAHQRPNARALMPLLDLVPPALALVQHHRGLFDKHARVLAYQIEQGRAGSRNRRIELPARKDRGLACAAGNMRLQLGWRLAAFQSSARTSAASQPRIDRLQQLLRRWSLSERKQQHFVNICRGPLRLWIETPDGLDLVAEEIDAHRALHLRTVNV